MTVDRADAERSLRLVGAPTASVIDDEAPRLVNRLMRELPGALACGFIDLRTGDWIALESVGRHPEDFLGYLAAHARELFEGDAVHTVKTVLKEAGRGASAAGDFEEIVMRSAATVHVFVRWDRDPQLVVAVVTRRETRLGLILGSMRTVLGKDVAAGL